MAFFPTTSFPPNSLSSPVCLQSHPVCLYESVIYRAATCAGGHRGVTLYGTLENQKRRHVLGKPRQQIGYARRHRRKPLIYLLLATRLIFRLASTHLPISSPSSAAPASLCVCATSLLFCMAFPHRQFSFDHRRTRARNRLLLELSTLPSYAGRLLW